VLLMKGSTTLRAENTIATESKMKTLLPLSSSSIKPFDETCQTDIPRIIHQSYISIETLPDRWKMVPAAWKKTHPDFEYRFWSDEDNRELIRTKYPWFLPVYDGYPNPISRADAARYFVIYTYGGIYADMDIIPLRSLVAPLLCHVSGNDQRELLVMQTPNLGFTNAFFAAKSNSTVLHALIHELPNYQRPLLGYFFSHFAVLFSAGPTRFWMILNRYPQLLVSVPAVMWTKCSVCAVTCATTDDSVTRNLVGNSWHKWDGKLFNWIFCHARGLIFGGLCILLITWWKLRRRHNRQVNDHYN